MKLVTPPRCGCCSVAILSAALVVPSISHADLTEADKYIRLYAGVGWFSEGKNERLDYGKGNFDQLVDDSKSENGFQYGVGAGLAFPAQQGVVEVGVGWYGDVEHDYKGYIDQYGKRSLRDFRYSYKVQSFRLMLEGRWVMPLQEQLEGFITGGVGAAWNELRDYEYSNSDPSERSLKPVFKQETKSSFAWQVGAGVCYQFMPELKASVFYLYTSNGKAEAKAKNSPFSNKYETDDLTSHSLMFSLSQSF